MAELWIVLVVTLIVMFIVMGQAARASGFDEDAAPYERCALCHGLFGDSPRAKFPKLAGQRPAYLTRQITRFQEGQRSNDGGQMVAVVTELAPADIPAVVDWFASQPSPRPSPADTTRTRIDGEALYVASRCAECHDETAAGADTMPFLSAQHPQYLAKQMRDIRDGLRPGGRTGEMVTQLNLLNDAEIDDVAVYLATLERPQ